MNYFPFSTPSLIGLDIQPDGIRLVQLKKNKRDYLVERIAMSSVPAGIFAEGKIKQWDSLSSVLSELVQALSIKGATAAINLPANLVRMQRMQLPSGLSDTEIEAEIDARMQQDLPGMTDSLCIDFKITAERKDAQVDVFFAAARYAYLTEYVKCLDTAGLKAKIVDVDIYALRRAAYFSLRQELDENAVHALVHVVNTVASLIVFNARDIIFSQHWDVTDDADLLGQIKNNMQICLATFRHMEVRKLLLCAAAGRFNVIWQDLTPSWAFQICSPNPFAHMRTAKAVDVAAFAPLASNFLVACGAAMREVPAW